MKNTLLHSPSTMVKKHLEVQRIAADNQQRIQNLNTIGEKLKFPDSFASPKDYENAQLEAQSLANDIKGSTMMSDIMQKQLSAFSDNAPSHHTWQDELMKNVGWIPGAGEALSFQGGVNEGAANTFKMLDGASKMLSDATGLSYGGGFKKASEFYKQEADASKQEGIGSDIMFGAGHGVEMMAEMLAMPAARLNNTAKITNGVITEVPKFTMQSAAHGLFNTYSDISDKNPDTPMMQKLSIAAPEMAKGAIEGTLMHGLGYASGKIGDVAKALTGNEVLKGETAVIANSLLFGSYGAMKEYEQTGEINPKTFYTDMGVGAALSAPQIHAMLVRMAEQRVYDNTFTASPEAVKAANDMEGTSEELRDKAQKLTDEAAKESNGDKKKEMFVAATGLNNAADIKAGTKILADNSSSVSASINKDNTLNEAEKKFYKDKVNYLAENYNPQMKAAKALQVELYYTNTKLYQINSDEGKSNAIKMAETAPLVENIAKINEQINNIFAAKPEAEVKTEGETKVNENATKEIDKSKSVQPKRESGSEGGSPDKTSGSNSLLGKETGNEKEIAHLKWLADNDGAEPEELARLKELSPQDVPKQKGVRILNPTEKTFEIGHTEDTYDKKGETNGQEPSSITPKGEAMAEELKTKVKDEGVTHVTHSPVERAVQTTEEVTKGTKIKSEPHDGLSAWDKGDFVGTDKDFFPEEHFVNHPDEKTWTDDKGKEWKVKESFNEFKDRDIAAYNEIVSKGNKGEAILSHSTNMRLREAMRNNGGEWNEAAKKEFLKSKKPDGLNFTKHEPKAETRTEDEIAAAKKKDLEDVDKNEALKLFNEKDLPALKEIAKKDVNKAIQKYKGMTARLNVAAKEGRISEDSRDALIKKAEQVLGHYTDMTESRKIEKQMEADKTKKEFSESVKQDIENIGERVKQAMKSTVRKNIEKAGGKLETMGNDIDSVIDSAVKIAKKLIDKGTDFAIAIDQAFEKIKDHPFIKDIVSKGGITEADIKKNISELSDIDIHEREQAKENIEEDYAKVIEDEFFGERTKTYDAINKEQTKVVKTGVKKFVQDMKDVIGKFGNDGLSQSFNNFGNGIDRAVEKMIAIDTGRGEVIGKALQRLGRALNVFARVGTTEEVARKNEEKVGSLNKAMEDSHVIQKELRKLVVDENGKIDKTIGAKVHYALDPEFYKEKTIDQYRDMMEARGQKFDDINDQDLQDQYQNYQSLLAKYKPYESTPQTLTPKEKMLYDYLRSINDFVNKANFAMGRIDARTYKNNKGKYIARMYKVFELPEDMQELLTKTNKAFEDMYGQRGDVGEFNIENVINDPIYLTTMRLQQTMANKAVYDYADWITKNKDKLVSTTEKEGFVQLGKGYGALSNKYVAQHIAEDLKGFLFTNSNLQKLHGLMKNYDKNGLWGLRPAMKKLLTVYNPATHLGNYTSNIPLAGILGIDPLTLHVNMVEAHKEIKNYGSMYRFALKAGIVKNDLMKADLKQDLKDFYSEIDNAGEKDVAPWYKAPTKAAERLYSNTDEYTKLAALISLIDAGHTPEKAVSMVAKGFQNINRMPKAYDLLSKTPYFGNPFVRWSADLARIGAHAVTQKPLNTAGYLATLAAISAIGSAMSGESDDKKKIREARGGIPNIPMPDRLGGDIPLEVKVGNNKMNIARLISPFYIYNDQEEGVNGSFRALQKIFPFMPEAVTETQNPNGNFSATFAKNNHDPALSFLNVMLSPSLAKDGINLTVPVDADFRGVSILDPEAKTWQASSATTTEKIVNATRYLARSYGGPVYSLGEDFYNALSGKPDYYNRFKTPTQAVMNFVGFKSDRWGDEEMVKSMQSRLKSDAYDFVKNADKINTAEELYKKKMESINKRLEDGDITKKQAAEQQATLLDQSHGRIAEALQNNIKITDRLQRKIKLFQPVVEREQLMKFINSTKGVSGAANKINAYTPK